MLSANMSLHGVKTLKIERNSSGNGIYLKIDGDSNSFQVTLFEELSGGGIAVEDLYSEKLGHSLDEIVAVLKENLS